MHLYFLSEKAHKDPCFLAFSQYAQLSSLKLTKETITGKLWKVVVQFGSPGLE